MSANSLNRLLLTAGAALLTTIGTAQSDYQQVVTATQQGNKVFLEINALLLQQSLDSLFSQSSGTSGTTGNWNAVLQAGNSPGMNVDFDAYDAFGIADLTATGTLTADSLVLNKDAAITGKLNVSDVTALGDSLTVNGFVEFSDSLNVVKAVVVGQTLFVTGVTSLGDSLHVAGNVDLDALFNVDGAATFASEVTIQGRTTINNALQINALEIDSANASGTAAVARGYGAAATGNHAMALDSLARALGQSSKALGRESVAYSTDGLALGYKSQAADSSLWASDQNGWHAVALGAESDALGTHSYALGENSSVHASATNAFALGSASNVDVSAHFAVALGASSNAMGVNSLAFGQNSQTGPLSHFSLALGYGSQTANSATVAMGYNSTANMFHAMALGHDATASGTHSYALGQYSDATMDQAIAMGRNSTASAPHAFTLGEYATASGYGSRALGYYSVASGPTSYALGWQANASGHNSLAFGEGSTATLSHAIALGQGADALAYGSLALGANSTTTGTMSMVQAVHSEANSAYEVVLGAYSDNTPFGDVDSLYWVGTDPLFVLGNGSADGDRSNALVIRKDGAAAFSDSVHVAGHVTLGDQLTVSGLTAFSDSVHATSAVQVGGTLSADSIRVTKVIDGQISNLSNLNTDTLAEGTTNLYYTDARVNALLADTLTNFNSRISALETGGGAATWSCGDDVEFDNYHYGTVQIGTQCWFSENLRSTHYADSTLIPVLNSGTRWAYPGNANDAGRCLYDSSFANLSYGYLYNFFAVTNLSGLCPVGWHVPSQSEWETLKTAAGGASVAGGRLKSTHWDGEDAYGFNAIPAGYRLHNTGLFDMKDGEAWFWTSTPGEGNAIYYMQFNSDVLQVTYEWSQYGGSVRCLQDVP